MKKKAVSLLILCIYLFGGFGITFGATNNGIIVETENGITSAYKKNSDGTYTAAPATVETENGVTTTYIKNPDGTYSTIAGDATKTAGNISSPSSGGPDDMTSINFTLNPGDLSPSEKKYTGGTMVNLKTILANIGKYLLIATTTIAVLSIVIGGLMIATTGPSDRAAKGKTIIMLNIIAVIIALFSYSIIKLVSWLLV